MTESTFDRPAPALAAARRQNTIARRVRAISKLLIHLVLIVGGFAVLIPFFWMVSASLKPDWEIFQIPPTWIPEEPLWQNYAIVLTGNRPDAEGSRAGQGWSFMGFVWNTAYVTAWVMVGRLLTASLAAYGFARLRFPGRNVLFIIMLATMMVPGHVTMIPLYFIFKSLQTLDTYWPLVLPVWFGGGAFFIFLLRQFINSIPPDYDDAARIDGCSWLGVYWRIILPMIKPALGAVAIFSFMASWNDFMGPLIYISSMDKYTVAIGLHFFKNNASPAARPLWNLMMAASVVAMVPPLLLFFFAQRYYIQGIVVSGIKG
ncbi:MAG: carbohydrate ABC transporter permease [Caldilineaceae bacterium]|nr:carbohydrate ABC transporter permease [Caldilineaceae bacterium]MDE0339298.1 carbohydrate ABC transporter permease [Caldilineaceae bacterium]